MVNFDQCRAKVEKEYKDFKVLFGFEHKGNYYYGLVPKDVPKNETPLIEFHIVNPESGKVSGFYSISELMEDPEFERQLNNVLKKSDVIEHHGIAGQKWGIKNGPPYPLDKETHDKVSEKGIDPELAAVGAEALATLAVGAGIAIYDAIKKRREHKRLTQKIHLESDDLGKKGVADLSKLFSEDSPPKKIVGEHTIEDDMAKVNPLYDAKVPKTSNNCLLCSITYDLRRRGYDVTSLLTSEGMYGRRTEKECYKNSKSESYNNCRSYKQVESEMLKKYPEGSRGILHLQYLSYIYGNFGHACNWEIKNGKLVVIDTQRNIKGSISDKQMTTIFMPGLTSTCRTDNLKVNWEKMNNICAEVLDKEIKHSDWGLENAMPNVGENPILLLGKDFIEHHGIKGQKWGVIRSREKGKVNSLRWKSKDASKLSDDELNRRNSRLQREKQYRELTKSRGQKFLEGLGKNTNKIMVASLVGVVTANMSKNYKTLLSAGSEFVRKKATYLLTRAIARG